MSSLPVHIENQRRINKCIQYSRFPFCEMRSIQYGYQSQMVKVCFASQEITLRDFVEYDIDDLIIPIHAYTLGHLGLWDHAAREGFYNKGGFTVYEVENETDDAINDKFYLQYIGGDILLTDVFHLLQLTNL